MYNEFLIRKNDPAFANYVQQSNARCNYANQNVCCPSAAAPVTQAPVTKAPVTKAPVTQSPTKAPAVPAGGSGGWPAGNIRFDCSLPLKLINYIPISSPGNPNNFPARLLKPEEGCGYSNETLNRIVGGVPAKLGQWPWMALIGYKWVFFAL